NQGPIVLMIENYRTRTVWNQMRECAPIKLGLQRAGFSGEWLEQTTEASESAPSSESHA
ncbi:MAG: hypothetical protein KGQ32_10840, partial [Xanthomonadaceae bacterium]|nr:hypothetical protein [Xanthomonadaceae bacterium]